jgi:formylglycine-generating enzyme required for sulfatase activity
MPRLLALAALLFALPAYAEVNIEWVTVGDPGNACDTQSQGCFGAVPYVYRIGKYEVTNAQYAEFLNAVAVIDTNALYNTNMGVVPGSYGGITRSGSSGSYSYNVIVGRDDISVNYVSFWDALRFANWLHNGQPAGAQDNTTTEDGAYTLTPSGITNNTVMRNTGVTTIVVPSEDEWYKAAYYAAGAMFYFDYPAGSDLQTVCAAPGPTANSANCLTAAGGLTGVGSYTGSASPNGTFDQGGNVWEWNEAIISGSSRNVRGGSLVTFPASLGASDRSGVGIPTVKTRELGFRVASLVPQQFPQGIPALGPIGLLVVAAGLLGFGVYRRGRA